MDNLFDDVDWPLVLRRFSVVAAVGLLVVSYIGFQDGLNFKGEWYVATCLWFAFTIIQFIGNYSENQSDWIFFAVWVFTYVTGVGAGTWAAYGWIEIDNSIIRWACAIGLGGAAEMVPERLIALFIKSMRATKKSFGGYTKPSQPANPKPQTFSDNNRSEYKPQHRPQPQSFKPVQQPRKEPTYNDPMRDYEEPRF